MEISRKTRSFPSDTVPFDCGNAEDEPRSHQLFMEREIWEQMDSPDVITVTIVPGDMLNVEDDNGGS